MKLFFSCRKCNSKNVEYVDEGFFCNNCKTKLEYKELHLRGEESSNVASEKNVREK